ncbi:MAG: hypothetical protein MJA29_07745, partial [Candidatus Omnitrophica bacterium]|nr:hypothetical protein [Candidatus Omnitrophota bacterium]
PVPTTSQPSVKPVKPSTASGQLKPTKTQLTPTKNQLNSNNNNYLTEQGQQAKGDLEILVATGKSKEFTGKQLTFQDLDYMSEKDLLKYYRIYQSTLAVRVNDTFSKYAVKTYCTLANWLLPIENKDRLYEDLRNDYILQNELDKWTGWLSLKMGGLMAVASTTLITVGNLSNINKNESTRNNGDEGRQSQEQQSNYNTT